MHISSSMPTLQYFFLVCRSCIVTKIINVYFISERYHPVLGLEQWVKANPGVRQNTVLEEYRKRGQQRSPDYEADRQANVICMS